MSPQTIPYTLIPCDRKTVSLQIKSDGSLVVRCPRRCSRREVQKFVESKDLWIRENLQKIQAARQIPRLTEDQLALLSRKAREDFPKRVRHFAPLVGVDYGKITIRCQKTRWGSCSSAGNLNFNLLLMLAPEEIRDYVTVHELCHRKHMDHSSAFWKEVERVLPNYRSCRKWLKDNGGILMAKGGQI